MADLSEHDNPKQSTKDEVKLPLLAIVGIGASAGGLEAAMQLIDPWKPNPGLALQLR